MKELVALPLLSAMRNSFILTGCTLRTLECAVSDQVFPKLFQLALAFMSPLNSSMDEVTAKVAYTLSPGSMVLKLCTLSVLPWTLYFQPLGGTTVRVRPTTVSPMVLVNFTVTFWVVPGAQVWSPAGASIEAADATSSIGTSYFAATMFA